jgi:hypothetical protein
MLIRVLIAATVAFVSPLAKAQTAHAPWRAAVQPPRPGLPAVTVEVGYPGPYLPAYSVPITLRAAAGDVPFDGYIGFQFRRFDTPVFSRALLRPRQSWTFSTFARPDRALTIEWRDASMKTVGTSNAGSLPSTPVPSLRITRAAGPARALGLEAYGERPEALPDRAQWFNGFDVVVTPLDVWIDLPRRVREAIFGSGIRVIFFGLPRPGQQLDDLDRALLPVTFQPALGSYVAPWPYGNGAVVPTTVSWVPKHDARPVGNGALPYIVDSPSGTWVADEAGVNQPIPNTAALPMPMQVAMSRAGFDSRPDDLVVAWPRPSRVLREQPAFVLTMGAALLSVFGWLILRRRPRIAAIAILMLGVTAVVAARDRIRPHAGTFRYEIVRPVSAGLVVRLQVNRTYGASPIAAEPVSEAMRSRLGGSISGRDWELRTSETPMGMGAIRAFDGWDAIWRRSYAREIASGPTVRIRKREGQEIVLEYESTHLVDLISARWLCGDDLCVGSTAVRRSTRGTVTIRNRHTVGSTTEHLPMPLRQMLPGHEGGSTRVWLIDKGRAAMRMTEWIEHARPSGSVLLIARGTTQEGSGSFTFALPREVSPASTVLVSVKVKSPSAPVDLEWASGRARLTPTGRSGVLNGTRAYLVPATAVSDIIAAGGIVRVNVAKSDLVTINPFQRASIEIWEKKS